MIVTITINPAVDKSTTLDKLIPEKKLRCSDLLVEAGGGGINVSKAIEKLGGESLAMFPSGGANGKLLEGILFENKIPFKSIPVENETRESFTATELSTNAQYRFVMPGGNLSSAEIDSCLSTITALNPLPSIIIASGSLPPGAPDDIFARLAVIAKKRGIKLIVDTSGKPLHLAAQEGVYLLKPNLSELCSLVNKDYLQMSEVDEAAKHVIRNGHCEVMVVSMGPAGAMLVTKDMHEKIPAPTVKKLSTVGAGDSMVGGMAWMLEKGKPLLEMVRFGVACGTAATMNSGTQLFKKEDVYRLYQWINQHSISFAAA
ncbi:MAG: 1-phosphofructokinase family hexose kinase [Sediminibacterium magnilacihabitans]|jgi:6-phosphofructokinase 2|nr:1-phosphofructokinase family hexose kinase [Sediminibacterium magnilacihabitans]PQV61867.1 6-phosphofructokinase 2 [Sediminibacterium magnilacihabitans]HET9056336.1 1-phosphofructokinase family hexose kinase [Chitinophagaceae bacterium]